MITMYNPPGFVVGVQTIDQRAVAGISTNINIQCNLGRQVEAPFWFINVSVYELFSIRLYVNFIPTVESYSLLTIPTVTEDLNGTIFQCASFNEIGMLLLGIAIRLIVFPSNK